MSDVPDRFDLIVVGLGAMGAAVLLQARRLGLRVLGLDRHDPPHELGSSHAETRMTRLAVGEGLQYLPFVARSHEIWRQLERETGEDLLFQSGGCIITTDTPGQEQRWNDFVTATGAVAGTGGIEFETVTPEELRRRQPAILVGDEAKVGLEPTGGVVLVERAVEVQLRLARAEGSVVRTGEPVVGIEIDAADTEVTVTTAIGRYRAERVVAATGAWLTDLTPAVDREALTVTRQVVFWFEAGDPAAFSTHRFPFVIWVGDTIEDYLGVFPIPPGGIPGVKVLGEQFSTLTDPASVDRTVSRTEIEDFHRRMVRPRVAGVGPRCIRSAVCLYTNTPDDHFLIDAAPHSDRLLTMSACSGHGFKHSAGLVEAVAQLVATGSSDLDLSPFRRRW